MELINSDLDLVSGLIAFIIVAIIAGLIALKANKDDVSVVDYIMDEIAPVIALSLSAAAVIMIIAVVVRHVLQYFTNSGVM